MGEPSLVARFVLADLKPKARPRVTRGNTYTPRETLDCEAQVAYGFRQRARGHQADKDTRWAITIQVWPKSKRQADLDNLAKTVLDGLNGVAYHDDSQVDSLQVTRLWSPRPRPHVGAVVACYSLT